MTQRNHYGEDDPSPTFAWSKYFGVSDILQLLAMLIVVVISYVRLDASNAELRTQVVAQAALLSQLHESVDQLRTTRSATPEAAQRIAVLETRVSEVEMRNQFFSEQLQRIENKIDDLRKELRR